jgi:hypothetical protein
LACRVAKDREAEDCQRRRETKRQKIARVAEDSQNAACQKLLNFRKFTKRYVIYIVVADLANSFKIVSNSGLFLY